MIQTVGIDEVAHFVDAVTLAVEKNFAGAHANRRIRFHSTDQFLDPASIRLRIIIQCRNVAALSARDACIAASGKSFVHR